MEATTYIYEATPRKFCLPVRDGQSRSLSPVVSQRLLSKRRDETC